MSNVHSNKSRRSKRRGIPEVTISFCTEEDTKILLAKLAAGEAVICGGSMFSDEENDALLRAVLMASI